MIEAQSVELGFNRVASQLIVIITEDEEGRV